MLKHFLCRGNIYTKVVTLNVDFTPDVEPVENIENMSFSASSKNMFCLKTYRQ